MRTRPLLLQGKTAGVLALVLGALMAVGIAWRAEIELASATQSFRRESSLEAQQVARQIEASFERLGQGLQAIARLPGVRQLRHPGDRLSDEGNAAFFELGTALAVSFGAHDLWICPIFGSGASSAADPRPWIASLRDRREEPGQAARAEDMLLRRHLSWLRSQSVTDASATDAATLAIADSLMSGNLDPAMPQPSSIVYSVPYFGSDGVISGCISTSLPEAVIQSRLTEGRFVVRCVQDSVTVTPSTPGLWQQEHGFLARGEPDPTLLYSEVLPLRIAAAGPSWLLWAGKENTKFEERSDVRSARSFRVTGWAVCFGMVASMLAIAWLVTSHRVRTEAVNRDLEQHVAERTRELISANDALQIANAKAEAGSRAKSEFLANMSHEIRTPMTAILGYADLLIESEQTQEERQMHVRTIRRNGDHLLAIINDILDLSKIEAGKLRIERIQTSPMQILEHVASLMRVRASEKHLGFHVEVLGAIPETISSDPTRLRQILLNLTGNAVKFTLTGELRITMQMATSASAEHPRLKIAITDSGIGMRKEQIDTLFVAFSQADASTTRRFGGTGLGLVITRHLAQLLGGDVTVQSRYGEGSTFEVTIATGPLQGVRMLDTREQERADLDPKVEVTRTGPISARVLLAEDGPDNQRLISLFLRRAGATVTVAGNGRIACEFVERAAAAGEPFDVILMDMQMPEMDGYAAAGELRKKGHRTPIIALTAHAMEGDREKCIAAGCSDYATKPIQRERLLAVLRQHLP